MKFSKTVLSLVISVALVAGPETVVFAQSDTDFSNPPSGWDSSKLSQAVQINVHESVRNYMQKKQMGLITASDVEVAAAAMKTAMDHLQEIGYNASLEKRILENEEAFLNYHPSDSDVQFYQKTLAVQGIQADISRVRSSIDPGDEARHQFLSMVKKQGLYKTELAFVEEFRTQELQYVSQTLTVPGSIAHHQPRNVRLMQTAMSSTCKICFVAAAIGLASGCTITMPACDATLIACAACAAGA